MVAVVFATPKMNNVEFVAASKDIKNILRQLFLLNDFQLTMNKGRRAMPANKKRSKLNADGGVSFRAILEKVDTPPPIREAITMKESAEYFFVGTFLL